MKCEIPRKKAFFASYISEFDCSEQTEWWFTIKDDAYDLSVLSANRRYKVTKARKFCEAHEIQPLDSLAELFDCYKDSFTAYPKRYRPKEILFDDFEKYIRNLQESGNSEFFATYFRETKKLVGFLIVSHRGTFLGLTQQKTNPSYEKYNSNASLIDCVLTKYNDQLRAGQVIFTNGSRSIKHETNFNAYLEKYFGFRKAYAKLHIVYRFPFGIVIKILRPFRRIFARTGNPLLYNLYCVLKMDGFAWRGT